jgi:hypothetical protein
VRAGTSRAKKVRVTKKRVISPQLSITGVSSRTLDAGQSVTVTGMGSANARGLRVYLEAGAAGSWGSIASGYVKRDRTISLSGPITSAGAAVPLRLRIAGSKWITETASAATSVTVYGWYYLSDLDRVDSSSWGDEGSYNINGVTYDKTVKSLTYTEAGWAEWDLARKCRTLETTVGLLDTADSDAIRHGRISVDTVDKWAVTNIKLGQSYPVSIGINGASGIRQRPHPLRALRSARKTHSGVSAICRHPGLSGAPNLNGYFAPKSLPARQPFQPRDQESRKDAQDALPEVVGDRPRMRNDHGSGEDEPCQVEAVVSRIEPLADDRTESA